MILPFKQKLFNMIQNLGLKTCETMLVDYANVLGYDTDDYMKAYFFLQSIDDKQFCGEGLSSKAKYYLYDGTTFYWFVSRRDAELYACPNSLNAVSTREADQANSFATLWRKNYWGFWFLYPNDLIDLDEIVSQKKNGIMNASDPRMTWESVEACAE